VVHGGSERDDIWGMAGGDVLMGDEGDDRIRGDGPDAIESAPIIQTAAEQHGADILDGGTGDDVIYAGTGADVVHGGSERDDIWGMAGGDVLIDGGYDNLQGVSMGRRLNARCAAPQQTWPRPRCPIHATKTRASAHGEGQPA
jgi:Ca2+-binding RTX toxin-like protein